MVNNIQSENNLDVNIQKCLINQGVLTSPRILMCGRWFNKIIKNKKKITKYFCSKWECRICRIKLLKQIDSKHTSYNKDFLRKGGKIMKISLKAPEFPNNKHLDFYIKFKKSLKLLKESRGWEKLKILTNGKYHYDNIEIIHEKNKYQLYNHIIYGISNDEVVLDDIEWLLFSYWFKITKKLNFYLLSKKSICTSYVRGYDNYTFEDLNENKLEYLNKDIISRTNIIGTLENLEKDFYLLATKPITSLRSLEYIKNKQLLELGNAIKEINLMQHNTKRGRIWGMK